MAGLDGRIVQTQEELERIEDSNRLRRELLPFHLIERVGFRVLLSLWLIRFFHLQCCECRNAMEI